MTKSNNDFITGAEAAAILGFSPDHTRRLIREGKIKGKKIGRNWIIKPKDIANVKRLRKANIKD